MKNRWDLSKRAQWESARTRGRGLWVVREVALMLPVLLLIVWVALKRERQDDLFWLMMGCVAVLPFLLAFVLSSLYAAAERQHAGENDS